MPNFCHFLHRIVSWVLPDYRTIGYYWNKSALKNTGYWTYISVPNVLSLSSIKYSCPIFLMFEWILDTEISSPILTSHEAFLPICKFYLVSVFKMKKTLLFENSSFWLPELNVSNIMKLSLGLSTSIISTILLFKFIENGNFCLHSSQFTFLNFIMTCPFTAFMVLLRSSHSRRHLRWMPPMVPLQWQGLIIGLKLTFSISEMPLS